MEINKLIPFIVGLIVGIVVLLKLINYLLEKHYGLTYSIIIGFSTDWATEPNKKNGGSDEIWTRDLLRDRQTC